MCPTKHVFDCLNLLADHIHQFFKISVPTAWGNFLTQKMSTIAFSCQNGLPPVFVVLGEPDDRISGDA
jgi:hypothetical protein